MPDNLERTPNGVYYFRKKYKTGFVRRSLRTSNRTEAKKRAKALEAKIEARLWGDKSMSWQEAVVKYTTEVAPGTVKPGTLKRYNVSFRQVDMLLRGTLLHEIDRAKLNEVIAARRKQIAKKKKTAPGNATINRDLTAISRVLDCGIEWEACKENPAKTFNRRLLTRELRGPITIPSDEEVATLINRAPGLFARLIEFLSLEGTREEETADLQWHQVRFTATGATVTLLKTKTSVPRTIDLRPETVAMLRALPRFLSNQPGRGNYLFWHHDGDRYRNVASRIAHLRTSVGLTLKAHHLRHRFAILYLARNGGEAIYDLQKHLGHRSIKTTEIYLGYVSAVSLAYHQNYHQPDKAETVSGDTALAVGD